MAEGYRTPTFGSDEAVRYGAMLGRGDVLWCLGDGCWPRFPAWVCLESDPEKCLAGGEAARDP
jgi:hypothetical protein